MANTNRPRIVFKPLAANRILYAPLALRPAAPAHSLCTAVGSASASIPTHSGCSYINTACTSAVGHPRNLRAAGQTVPSGYPAPTSNYPQPYTRPQAHFHATSPPIHSPPSVNSYPTGPSIHAYPASLQPYADATIRQTHADPANPPTTEAVIQQPAECAQRGGGSTGSTVNVPRAGGSTVDVPKAPRFQTYVVVDVETTGLPASRPRMTEIALVAAHRDAILECAREAPDANTGCVPLLPRVVNKLTLCFNPQKAIHPDAARISGIAHLILRLSPPFSPRPLHHFSQRICTTFRIIYHETFVTYLIRGCQSVNNF